ncbi:toprim domain-containing protein [Emticicia sp. 17c]|uniref:toprim domain-containing protein n=1 Tax=Emticicia sp. 17c TaxID=3127704 RepID=UPI00301B9C9F
MKPQHELDLAKSVSMIALLESIGYKPKYSSAKETFFISPFRDERTASFSVDEKQNLWIDRGVTTKYDKGDSPIGFVKKYFNLSFPAAVEWLLKFNGEHHATVTIKQVENEPALQLLTVRNIKNPYLISYAQSRSISYTVLSKYCKEVVYKHTASNRIYTAIGFKNASDGYELRFNDFKACLGKKDITFIDNYQSDLLVFEGFFDFLSFIELDVHKFQANYLILNSVALLNRFDFSPVNAIYSYLDNDKGGREAYDKIKQLHQPKYIINASAWNFPNHKDLNEYLIWLNKREKPTD